MARSAITKRTVDATKPATKDLFVWDNEVSGFGLKVTPAGGKVYVYQYRIARPGEAERTPAKRYTIGKHGNLTPDQARKRAKELAALVEVGVDPRKQELAAFAADDEAERAALENARLEGELAFEKVAERWLEHYENEKGRRPRTIDQARRIVKTRLEPALKGKPLPHINRADLQAIIDSIPIKNRASRLAVYAYASILFRWAMERGEIADNPVRLMAKPSAPAARDRVLTENELATVWQAADTLGDPYSAFFKLLILTGQRREEVAGMGWGELDRATSIWTIPAKRAKNGRTQIVPLAPVVAAELDRLALAEQMKANAADLDCKRWPKFGPVHTTYGKTSIKSYSKAKAELDEAITKARKDACPLPAWRVHDLRRTLATGLQKLGTRFEVTEAVLNHISGSRSGVAGIYQQHDWKEEKRTALEAWARNVAAILKPASTDNVVSLDSAKRTA
jgi:integrase